MEMESDGSFGDIVGVSKMQRCFVNPIFATVALSLLIINLIVESGILIIFYSFICKHLLTCEIQKPFILLTLNSKKLYKYICGGKWIWIIVTHLKKKKNFL